MAMPSAPCRVPPSGAIARARATLFRLREGGRAVKSKLEKLRALIRHLSREAVNVTLPHRAGVRLLLRQANEALRKIESKGGRE